MDIELTKKETELVKDNEKVYEISQINKTGYAKVKYTKSELEEQKQRLEDIKAYEIEEHTDKINMLDKEIEELNKIIQEIESEESE